VAAPEDPRGPGRGGSPERVPGRGGSPERGPGRGGSPERGPGREGQAPLSDGVLRQIVVALGSNLGDRKENLLRGAGALRAAGLDLHRFSSVYETPPIGFLEQPDFLNMVALGSTGLPPGDLLSIFQSVERDAGRSGGIPKGPRPLDLDLIFFGDSIIRQEGLRVPHRGWKERSFVVEPLVEIAPDLRDPETGSLVEEVAVLWPLEPEDIRAVQTDSGFRKALEEWER